MNLYTLEKKFHIKMHHIETRLGLHIISSDGYWLHSFYF